jgi:hypothetical protein
MAANPTARRAGDIAPLAPLMTRVDIGDYDEIAILVDAFGNVFVMWTEHGG